jgi:hypothetical protein
VCRVRVRAIARKANSRSHAAEPERDVPPITERLVPKNPSRKARVEGKTASTRFWGAADAVPVDALSLHRRFWPNATADV